MKMHGTQKAAVTLSLMSRAVEWLDANGVKAHMNDGLIGLAQKVCGYGVNSRKKALEVLMNAAKNPPLVAPGRKNGFYQSKGWLEARYEALKVNNGLCECCGRGKQHNVQLHVDHIKPRSLFPELALAVSNLQVLCHECNLGKGIHDKTDWRDRRAF